MGNDATALKLVSVAYQGHSASTDGKLGIYFHTQLGDQPRIRVESKIAAIHYQLDAATSPGETSFVWEPVLPKRLGLKTDDLGVLVWKEAGNRRVFYPALIAAAGNGEYWKPVLTLRPSSYVNNIMFWLLADPTKVKTRSPPSLIPGKYYAGDDIRITLPGNLSGAIYEVAVEGVTVNGKAVYASYSVYLDGK